MTSNVQAVYASWWRRFWAVIVDLILLVWVFGTVKLVTHGTAATQLNLIFLVVYQVGLTFEGGTVGMRMLRLRVVREDGSPLSLWRAALRELICKPLSLVFVLGVLWPLWERRHRAWHDLLAGSVVVSELVPYDAPEWRFNPPWTTTAVAPAVATPTPAPDAEI
jgi:uncharacterized RDD family membrane protein YckC